MTNDAGYLLDTNVISEIRRTRVDPWVAAFFEHAESDSLFLSVLTIGELRRGAAKQIRTNVAFATRLTVWVDGLEAMFAERILPVDIGAARRWGELEVERSLPVIDTLIAVTALDRELTLVTRNMRDVAETGVNIMNPWLAPT